jgi:peptidoglycan/LPS O-acetylase OafA/YrhL
MAYPQWANQALVALKSLIIRRFGRLYPVLIFSSVAYYFYKLAAQALRKNNPCATRFLLPLIASQIDFAVLIYSLSNDARAVAKILAAICFICRRQK